MSTAIISKINTGIVAEWLSIIDPQMANDLHYEEKIAAIIKSQIDLLIGSDINEVRSKHWTLTKRVNEAGAIVIEFALVAYSSKIEMSSMDENKFSLTQINRLRKKMSHAVEEENYAEAAKFRDMITSMQKEIE